MLKSFVLALALSSTAVVPSVVVRTDDHGRTNQIHACASPCKVRIDATVAQCIYVEGPYSLSHCQDTLSAMQLKATLTEGEWAIVAVGGDGKLSEIWQLLVQ